MKKILSLALTVLLILGCVSCLMTAPVSASVTTGTDLESADGWFGLKFSNLSSDTNTTTIGNGTEAPVSYGNPDNRNVFAYTAGTEVAGVVPSLYVQGQESFAYCKLITLEANKTYEISFDYYAGTFNSTSYRALSGVGIIKDVTSETKWSEIFVNDTQSSYLLASGYLGADKTANALVTSTGFKSPTIVGTDVTEIGKDAGVWHSFSAKFSTADTTSALFYIVANDTAGTSYLDNFKLEEVNLKTTTGADLESADDWKAVKFSELKEDFATVIANAPDNFNGNRKVSAYTGEAVEGRTPSLMVQGQYSYGYYKLITLKANTYYKISFDYYTGTIVETNARTKSALNFVGIAKDITATSKVIDAFGTSSEAADAYTKTDNRLVNVVGTAMEGDYTKATVGKNVTPISDVAGQWHTFSAEFNSGDTTNAVFYLGANDTTETGFLDNFSLEETEEKVINVVGNAMRAQDATKAQALRFKFGIDNSYLESYGDLTFDSLYLMAVKSEYLGIDEELLADMTETASGKKVKISQVLESNYQSGDNYNVTYFTAALYNIGARENGSIIEYSDYAKEYSVRAYIVYKDSSDNDYVFYSDTMEASVFAVMYAIEKGNSTDDKAVVEAVKGTAGFPTEAYNAYRDGLAG